MTRRKPGAVKGRPRLSPDGLTYIQLSLSAADIALLREVGGGNASAAVRILLARWRTENEQRAEMDQLRAALEASRAAWEDAA